MENQDFAILVNTTHKNSALCQLIESTWGKHVQNLFFLTDASSWKRNYIKVTDDDTYSSHMAKTFGAIQYAYDNLRHLNWFFFVCDDRYVFVDNLIKSLASLDYRSNAVYGQLENTWPRDPDLFYPLGGAGILFTRLSLEAFCRSNYSDTHNIYQYEYSDVAIGAICHSINIKLMNISGYFSQPPGFYNISEPQEHVTFHYIRTKEQFEILSRLDKTMTTHNDNPISQRDNTAAGDIPIIFIHTGDSDYLHYSLLQAKLSNCTNSLYLIGNTKTQYQFVQTARLEDYTISAIRFSRSYLHLSPNDSSFELFCLVRWFILRDFMLLNKLERAVYLDSDIMLYDNLQKEWHLAAPYDFAISGVAPPIMITNLSVLDEFCRLMEDTYGSEEGRQSLVRRYVEMQEAGIVGGICDMTFWETLKQSRPDRVLDLSIPDGNGAVYDRNIQLSEGFLMRDGIKQVTWQGGVPFGTRQDGSLARFKGLHFHGEKSRMRFFFHNWLDSLAAP